MVTTTIYVEGGGNSKELKTACRKGFRKFIERAGLVMNMPKIVACGGRGNAYQSFKKAVAGENGTAVLLVDAEAPLTGSSSWHHLKITDSWDRPDGATDTQCHLMVEVMESWFLADMAALQSFYGQGFRAQDLPKNPEIENVSKHDVLAGLTQATRDTKNYKKGISSFQILERLDTDKVRKASVHANNFIQALS